MPMIQDIDVPQDYICAITHQIMLDPVVDSQGRAFEREAITRWINDTHTHPTDRTEMKVEDLFNAPALSRLIRRFVEDNPTLLTNHEVHVPDNTGRLMIDAVNANNNGAVSYFIQASEGNGHRQDWLDGAFAVAATAMNLDLMCRLLDASAALAENTGQLMIDAVKADNADVIEFYIGASEGHEQRQAWLDGAFPVAAKGMKLDLMRRLHTAGSSMGDFTCTSMASTWLIFDVVRTQRRQDVLEFIIDNTPRGEISQEVLDRAFHYASENGDAAMINFLYNAGANVNTGSPFTCLYLACSRGDQATCKILIHLGATVDQPVHFNNTGIATLYSSTKNGIHNSTRKFIAHEIQKRSQILCALPPKVEELQQEVQTLKATVAQQSAQLTQQSDQIATLIAALQAQQSAHGSD